MNVCGLPTHQPQARSRDGSNLVEESLEKRGDRMVLIWLLYAAILHSDRQPSEDAIMQALLSKPRIVCADYLR